MRSYYRQFAALGAILAFGAFLWGGLDFAAATLLGFLVVSANLYWTKNLAETVLFGQNRGKSWVLLVFMVKFGITALILFYALVRLKMDPIGVIIGLSGVVVGTLMMGLGGGKAQTPPASRH